MVEKSRKLKQTFSFKCLSSKIDLMIHEICRQLRNVDKKQITMLRNKLNSDEISKALEMVAEEIPSFPSTTLEVNLDLTELSEVMLWRLREYTVEMLKTSGRIPEPSEIVVNGIPVNNGANEDKNNSIKQRRETCDAKATSKRTKKAEP
ncbi:transcription factor GTE1-like [Rutidosis leptorrhynchoides]|uniref:transcription factor GTE1-like n=1 Tax=Rutidosis leptorrhynchoides TaxID=125765 RepID=UPI003A9A2449